MIDEFLGHRKTVKRLANMLSRKGYAMEVRYKDEVVARLGKGVEPSMFGVLGPVEIKSMEAAVEIATSMGLI